MKQTHQLIKLRVETIQDLRRLMSESGQASLDNLIIKMIRLTDTYRGCLKETGWKAHPEEVKQ